jgi:hypothetical protein
MHAHVEHEFESLGNRLELKKAMEKENYCDYGHSLNVISFFGGTPNKIDFPLNLGAFEIPYFLPKLLESYDIVYDSRGCSCKIL